ncbi:hypothetical protein THRCLA_21306, partial [Thraustotheca clavata]
CYLKMSQFVSQQRYNREQQETDLDEVLVGARHLNNHARAINGEVVSQNNLLDALGNDVEAGANDLRFQAEKAALVNQQKKKMCWYYGVIAVLVIILIVLFAFYRQHNLKDQENNLEHIYAGAKHLHVHAQGIHNEVNQQNVILDNITTDVYAGAEELRIQAEKAPYVHEQSKKMCYYIVITILVLIKNNYMAFYTKLNHCLNKLSSISFAIFIALDMMSIKQSTMTTQYRRYNVNDHEADLDAVHQGAMDLNAHANAIHNEVQAQDPLIRDLAYDCEAGTDELRIQAEKAAYVNQQNKKLCKYYGVIALLVVATILLYSL